MSICKVLSKMEKIGGKKTSKPNVFYFVKNGNYWTILGDDVSTALYYGNIAGQREI